MISAITSSENLDRRPKWFALVNEQIVSMPEPEVSVHLLKNLAQIPPALALIRDYNSDVPLPNDVIIDLRMGNVFYSGDDCPGNVQANSPQLPKFAVAINNRWALLARPDQTGASIRELFDLENDIELYRDYESPVDILIDDETACPVKDGPIFCTRKCATFTVKVNNKPVKFGSRRVTGREIKETAIAQSVALCADCVLYRVKLGGGFGPAIRDDEKVLLREGDEFRCITPDDQS